MTQPWKIKKKKMHHKARLLKSAVFVSSIYPLMLAMPPIEKACWVLRQTEDMRKCHAVKENPNLKMKPSKTHSVLHKNKNKQIN